MIGDHATAFIASVLTAASRNYDVHGCLCTDAEKCIWNRLIFNAYKNGMGRRALSSYLRYGFIPMEDSVQEAFHKKNR